MARYPKKNIILGNNAFVFYGLSLTDPYFTTLIDGFEPEFTMFCEYFLDENSICLDIGANIGVKSLVMANFARNGKVYALEAAPSVAKVLRLNVEKNRVSNVVVEEKAVGEKEQIVHFIDNSCWGHVDTTGSNGVDVEMTTLMHIAEAHRLPKVDFVKIDIEGNEPSVIMSSMDFFRKYNPTVFIEFNSWCQMLYGNMNPMEFLNSLCDNFSYVYAVSKGDRKLLSQVEKGSKEGFLWRNIQRDGFVTDLLLSNDPQKVDLFHYMANIDLYQNDLVLKTYAEDYQNKTADPNDVINAYRMILGRDPENSQILDAHSGITTIKDLRKTLLESEEFRLTHY